MPRPQEKVSLHPLDFKEALSDLMRVQPPREPEAIRASSGQREYRDLMQVPLEWIEAHPKYEWCKSKQADLSDRVPEGQRADNAVYVRKGRWDKFTADLETQR